MPFSCLVNKDGRQTNGRDDIDKGTREILFCYFCCFYEKAVNRPFILMLLLFGNVTSESVCKLKQRAFFIIFFSFKFPSKKKGEREKKSR